MATSRPFFLKLGVRDQDVARRALQQLGAEGAATLGKLERGAQSASRQTGALTDRSVALRGAMSGLSRSLGPVGFALEGLATKGGLAAAAVAAIGLGISRTISAGTAYERQIGRIEALLRSTGGASGQTAAGIDRIAVSLGKATLASTRDVRDAAAALLTFRTVSGEAFGRTLTLAQDLAETFGTDLRSSTVQLAKALEDPERNLAQLNRSGISFSQTQIELIKGFVETGDRARAMSEILGTIERQVGGAGVGAAGGLAGGWDSLTEAVGRFFEKISQEGGQLDLLARGLHGVAGGVEAATARLTTGGRLERARAEEERLISSRVRGGLGGVFTPTTREDVIAQAATGGFEELRQASAHREALEHQLTLERSLAVARENAAEAARDLAAADRSQEETAARAAAERKKVADEAAKALEKELAAIDRREEAGADLIQSMGEENRLLSVRVRDGEAAAAVLEGEIALREKLGRDLLPHETEAVKHLIEERRKLNATIEASAEVEAKAKRAAEQAQREIERSIQHSADRMTDFAADAFEEFPAEILADPVICREIASAIGEALR